MTKTKLNALLATTAVLALAACGGGSTSNGAASYTSIASEGQRLIVKYQNEHFTSVSNMPTGSATYTGVAGFRSDTSNINAIIDNPTTISKAKISANFDNNTISGELTDFVDIFGERATGKVAIENGVISGNGFTATLAGSLTGYGETAPVLGNLSAGFVGPNAEAVYGEMSGNVMGEPTFGALLAER